MLTIVFICVMVLAFTSVSFAEVIIICNNSVEDTSLSKKDVKNIFLGKKTKWSDNKKIHFVTLKDSKTHKLFLKKYIQKNSPQFRNYWREKVFTGKARAPKQFTTIDQMLKYVSETEGAIGYVDTNAKSKLRAYLRNPNDKNTNAVENLKLSYLFNTVD